MFCSPQGLHAQLSLGPNAKGLVRLAKGLQASNANSVQMLCDVPNKSSALEFVYFVNLAKACQHFRDEKLCPNKEDRDIRPPEPGWILWDDRCSKRVPSDANQHAMIAKFFQGIKRCTDSFRTIFGQFFLGKLFEAFRIHVYRILYSVLYMLQCTCNQLGTSTVSQFNLVRSHSARCYQYLYQYRYRRIAVSVSPYQCITASAHHCLLLSSVGSKWCTWSISILRS